MKPQCAVRELLFDIELARKRHLRPKFAALGLTVGQGQSRILNSLLTKENITQKELAEACHLDVTTLSRTLDRMEDAGLLYRRRPPDCRRSFRIFLTEPGRHTAVRVRAAFQEVEEKIAQDFTPEELETLLAGLQKIRKNLD